MLGLEEIIVGSVMSIIGAIIIMHVSFINWTKKKQVDYNFELKKIKLRRKGKQAPKSNPLGALDYLEKFRNLNPETVNTILDFLSGNQEEKPQGLAADLLSFAEDNPETVKSFLSGILSGLGPKSEQSENLYK